MATKRKESFKTALRKYEGSAADKRRDAAGAKRMGVSKAAFERSPQDRREDRLNAKKLQKRDNAKRGRK